MENNGQQVPPEAANAIIGLIGSTFAELKKIDEYNVGGNANTKGIKTDVRRLIHEAQAAIATPPQSSPVPQPQYITPQPSPVLVPQPTITHSEITSTSQDSPDQLQFDFYKKITPEDLHSKLTDINFNLNSIVEKLNKVLKILTNADKDKQ